MPGSSDLLGRGRSAARGVTTGGSNAQPQAVGDRHRRERLRRRPRTPSSSSLAGAPGRQRRSEPVPQRIPASYSAGIVGAADVAHAARCARPHRRSRRPATPASKATRSPLSMRPSLRARRHGCSRDVTHARVLGGRACSRPARPCASSITPVSACSVIPARQLSRPRRPSASSATRSGPRRRRRLRRWS